ncbi:MAG: hypothetical protein AMJ78_03170 [Omnitrophica WOR_2 bacterium SM23_29]|nr:MAG: hypothetical protein AMJ78_03170 [Omnitrophica WOR_2 bacterium SM23_29]
MKIKNYNLDFRFILLTIFIMFLSLNIWGCGKLHNVEEIKKTVIESDPEFKDVLEKKAELDIQIEMIMSEFRKRQGEINSKIMELEEELKLVRRQAYDEVRRLKAKLEPQRQEVALKIRELKTTLRNKEGLLKTLKRSLRETEKLIEKSKELGYSLEDKAKWQREIDDLNSQIRPLESEIAKIKREIYIYRQKLSLLKQ